MTVVDAIDRCLAGDRAAYEELVLAHGDELVGILRAMLGNLDDARDVAQEAFVRAYSSLHRFDTRRPFRPWLFRIGRNLAINHLKARARRAESQTLREIELTSETKSPSANVLEGERRVAVERLLAQLRPQYRDVLVFGYMARLEYEQIATVMTIPVGTVKTWLNRAKASFRKLARGEELFDEE